MINTALDGGDVRQHLSSELGYSKVHSDLNVTQIGYVAREITKYKSVTICAPIARYRVSRDIVRKMIEPSGGF
jgi:sulfate adenylyltransferase